MSQRSCGRRSPPPPPPPVQILNNADGSVSLISGTTKLTVSEAPVTPPKASRGAAITPCQTRAQSKLKMETISPPKVKARSPIRPSPNEKATRPLVRATFVCIFCKHGFHSRGDLLKHHDKCNSVPNGVRSDDESTADIRRSRRHSDIAPRVEEKRVEAKTRSPPEKRPPIARPDPEPERLPSPVRSERPCPLSRRRSPGKTNVPCVKVEPLTPSARYRPGPKFTKTRAAERAMSLSNDRQPEPQPKRPPVRRSLQARSTVSKDRFINGLYLVPVAKVKDIEQEKPHNEIIEIDLTDESDVIGPKSPRAPATPRTLKSLLSFDSSQTSLNKDENENVASSSDSEGGETRPHEHSRHYHNITHSKTLLSIALTSTLGQKLHHLMDDVVEKSTRDKDYETYCRTPIKSNFQERLRFRDNVYPITFRKNKHYRRFYHLYKFTRKQKMEFMRTVTTGLNRRSRQLYRSLPRCSVRMKKLSARDIRRMSKIKPKPAMRLLPFADMAWRQPNILRRVGPKMALSKSAAFAAALLRSPNHNRIEVLDPYRVNNGPPRPVALFQAYPGAHQQLPQQPSLIKPNLLQHRQTGIAWPQPKPRAVAQVSPIMKPTHQQTNLQHKPHRNAAMVEEKIDDDLSIVVPAKDCVTILSDSDDSPRKQRDKRQLVNPSMPAPKVPRMQNSSTVNKSYSAPLTELPSPAKRVISAAATEAAEERTFLFRCHLCGMEERHAITHSKDIYKHLHSNHRGEVIHIVDYKLHGEVHLVEAMSTPPTVMKTAVEVANCSQEEASASAATPRRKPPPVTPKSPEVVVLDD